MNAPAPDTAGRVSRRARLFTISLAATVLVAMLPLPWRLSGLGFGALAMYAGIRLLLGLIVVRRTGGTTRGWLGVAVGLALVTFMMMVFAGQAAFYPLFAEQERCADGAVTYLDAADCQARFEQGQQEILRRLQGGT